MSKRPKTANAVMSRLRRPVGRLRDLPIWTKLALIMLVPTLATIIVGTNGLLAHIEDASNAEQARNLASLSQASGELSDHLQNERSAAVWLMSSSRSPTNRTAALKQYNTEHPLVDAAKRPYTQQKNALSEVPDKTRTLLLRLDRNLEDLPSLRSQVTSGRIERNVATKNYQTLINDLLNVRDASAQLALNPELSDHMRAAAAVARAKENVSQQRAVGHEVLGQGQFTLLLRRSFLLTDTGSTQADQTLRSVGTDAEVALYDQIVAGPDKRAATNYSNYFVSRTNENISDIQFNAEQWDAAMAGYGKLYRDVETRLDASIVSDATDLRGDVQRSVFLETSILLGMLLLAILFAWLVARSMARSLRELRQGALSIAQFGLPHAVGRLRDPSLSSSLTPAQLADQIAEPLPVRSRDEFGQVTEAFNAVHLEAVRTAAEQAALRSSVSTMFVNLARRSQILVDRLIGHLDRLERGEEDPDRLAELFQLDHLATRMRRNDENLLVLAGADSTRIQREPAALIDVLRAAQSEVEHYTRIEFGNVERDIEVSAHAVNDMVHLVAELFDNATAFSPPNSHVMVEARRTGERTTLYVEDRGIGISPDQLRELNERLANPPMVDVAVSRMMGLVVVARLANRHGVKVELRPAGTERGTVAEVGLPAAVLVPRAMAGRLQPGGATSFDSGPEQQSAPRPSFAAPLALESGPVGAGRTSGYPTGRPFDPNPPTLSGGMLGAGAGGGRSVPAWSDLTGAPGNTNGSNGSNGSNGFHGPRSNEVLPPNPYGSGDETLPRRRNGEPFPGDDDGQYGGRQDTTQSPQSFGGPQTPPSFGGPQTPQGFQSGASIPRQLPANPDNFGRNPFVPPVSAPPVSGRPVSAPPVSAPPAGPAPSAPHPSLVSPSGSYPVVPASAPPVSAPPAWPPVANDRDTGSTPTVPESLAAALDMTAEIPRVRDRFGTGTHPQVSRPAPPTDRQDSAAPARPSTDAQRAADHAAAAHEVATAQAAAAQATAAGQIAAAQAAARQRASSDNQSRFADETMELPIFRELESAWFQTARPGEPADKAAPANGVAQAPADADETESAPDAEPAEEHSSTAPVSARRYSTAVPTRSPSVPQQASSPESAPDRMSELSGGVNSAPDALPSRTPAAATASAGNGTSASNPSWQTAADDGWQAARAAAETPVDTTTTAGLPRRTPMAQLVPGGVDRAGASVQRRTPEAVRGLLSAYHRGVQRGRTKDQPTNPEETPGGQQSSQAGKEHEG